MESPMPAGLFLRAFQLIETTNHVLWYQINADRWVKEGYDLRGVGPRPLRRGRRRSGPTWRATSPTSS
ncbi:hypothetical protein ACW18T_02370 [Limosilactobacillus fermentum]